MGIVEVHLLLRNVLLDAHHTGVGMVTVTLNVISHNARTTMAIAEAAILVVIGQPHQLLRNVLLGAHQTGIGTVTVTTRAITRVATMMAVTVVLPAVLTFHLVGHLMNRHPLAVQK